MGKLYFNKCKIDYDTSIIQLDKTDNTLTLNYDFINCNSRNSTITVHINTSFIQNLSLLFSSSEEVYINLTIKKGEQNIKYYNLKFNIIDKIIIPLKELNPYTSCIEITILNNSKKGQLKIEKNLD